VVHDGSCLRNEFKSAAREVVTSGVYNIMPTGRGLLVDSQENISRAVGALLDMKTGAWMHNGRDARVSDSGNLRSI
jgi:hypothetical protein